MISDLLNTNEFNPYYTTYINNTAHEDIIKGLKSNLVSVPKFYSNIPDSKHNYAYADDKWTVKEILIHIIDTERIFAYRALRIARKDKTPLSGFEQDDYVLESNTSQRTLTSLIEEFKAVRMATIALYKSLNLDTFLELGVASGSNISVRALGYIITGHENHHNQIITERYL
ncbi:DinB family protein [Winogradskyella sp. UBA3174]|uniref:DinB family protein n=1 Tax=Winogradskyella sp. UBA3174 TaxID=1947785 RepID=UPI0025EC1966|nr:DinB family protein [Winogradskyella sp. UBA3174]|tara:strand:+ start:31506 stop:32021 length:516 start_codon:yes stop_codon:yes gene_type:complete